MSRSDFWRGRRVLVTGHTGFKGSWLSLWLQAMGAEVTGYALEVPTEPSLFRIARIEQGMRSEIGDIRDRERLAQVVREARPEVLLHLAAQPLVRESFRDPIETYSVNVVGTATVLDVAREAPGLRAILSVTSDKCYENREWVYGYRENDPMGGYDPYSSSKGCAELVSSAFRSSYFSPARHADHGVAMATARAGNVIGGGDWAADRLVPDILEAFAQDRKVIIRNPLAVRPWQHVLESIGGYLLLVERLLAEGPAYASGWNFGPEDQDIRPVSWIVDEMARRWGNGAGWEQDPGANPHEAHLLRLDISKARIELGWRPSWSLDVALDRIVEWHRQYLAGADMRAVTLGQIAAFQESRA
ncbi:MULTISPECIES: CDP-glucose 4,6-dehydratase [unclassified Sphingomonas]|nr:MULTISPECIES: CDP-glucose 4,6-dehydratase [unclassified Sphingomonas]